MAVELISVELTNRCGKACWFCYNRSSPRGETPWLLDDLSAFVEDCASHGVKAVSFGGGEPLEFSGLFELLARLKGTLFRSLTTNGLLLDDHLDRLNAAAPDKVHVSIHFPENAREVERVVRQVVELERRSIKSGVNLLVRRSNLDAARRAVEVLHAAGVDNRRIVYLPMRRADTPTPRELAMVAGDERFQSMSCLTKCGRSRRFCSVGWDRTVAWCSYTESRRALPVLTWHGLTSSLNGLDVVSCGGDDGGLVRLPGSSQHGHGVVCR